MPSKSTKSRTSSAKGSTRKTARKSTSKTKISAAHRASARGKTTQSTTVKQGSTKKKTRITIKCDVGYLNSLYLRGRGANLSWNKGTKLKNISADEWLWETTSSFDGCEFKVLINDSQYEEGCNHSLTCGSSLQYSPHFS